MDNIDKARSRLLSPVLTVRNRFKALNQLGRGHFSPSLAAAMADA